jgi:CheY-like chemotaxis protein
VVVANPLVLIVDDNDLNRKLARDLLRAAAFRTLEAGTATLALAIAAEHRPDVILLDLRLPDLDGTEVARGLKADPRTAAIPVVALTALRLEPSEEAWLTEAGFAGYLTKPFDADVLPELVRGFARRDAP